MAKPLNNTQGPKEPRLCFFFRGLYPTLKVDLFLLLIDRDQTLKIFASASKVNTKLNAPLKDREVTHLRVVPYMSHAHVVWVWLCFSIVLQEILSFHFLSFPMNSLKIVHILPTKCVFFHYLKTMIKGGKYIKII